MNEFSSMGSRLAWHSNLWWLVLGAAALLSPVPSEAQQELLLPPTAAAAAAAPESPLALSCTHASASGCIRVPKRSVLCAAAFDRKFAAGSHKSRTLKLCSWMGPGFDPASELIRFLNVESFVLTDSNITVLQSDFPLLRHLQNVQLTGLRLEALSGSVFAQLPSLRSLDLRDNALRALPPSTLSAPPLLDSVWLVGNPWDCSARDMDWLTSPADEAAAAVAAARVSDSSSLICKDPTFSRRPLLTVIQYRQAMEATCPLSLNCSCSLTVVPDLRAEASGDVYIPVVTVDCARRGLFELPDSLPANTTILHVEDNKISDLRLLVSNPAYASLQDLYLDGNGVTSVASLEGSAWLARFRLMSLRANRIRHLPVYALESALLRNRQAARLYLGSNPWHCDCISTPRFQEFLVKFRQVVQDSPDIRCWSSGDSHEPEHEVERERVRDVSRAALCREHAPSPVQPLDLLNAALAALILLILGKLAYDYWHFKRTGKLPWIVTKMP